MALVGVPARAGIGPAVALAAAAILGLAASPAGATTYIYTGNPFVEVNNPALGDSITVDVTLDTPADFTGTTGSADVESLSISTGALTLSGSEASIGLTLQDGKVEYWSVGGEGPEANPQISTIFAANGGSPYFEEFVESADLPNDFNGSGQGVTGTDGVGTPGTWNLQTGVPEPATWAMMLMGFAGLGAAMRRRREAVAV